MKFRTLHPWPQTPREAIELQKQLAAQVRLQPVSDDVRILAGIDVAFSPDETTTIAGVIVWDRRTNAVLEKQLATAPNEFPYVPGLLSFREVPAILAALRKIREEPQVILCDGQGIAHPRRIGLAVHLGLWLEKPTVGCAKSYLCGQYKTPGEKKGDFSPLTLGGEQVGVVLRTRDRVNPLFVSPGHLCDVDSARRLTLAATTRYRLPEPTRLAHQFVTQARTMV